MEPPPRTRRAPASRADRCRRRRRRPCRVRASAPCLAPVGGRARGFSEAAGSQERGERHGTDGQKARGTRPEAPPAAGSRAGSAAPCQPLGAEAARGAAATLRRSPASLAWRSRRPATSSPASSGCPAAASCPAAAPPPPRPPPCSACAHWAAVRSPRLRPPCRRHARGGAGGRVQAYPRGTAVGGEARTGAACRFFKLQ